MSTKLKELSHDLSYLIDYLEENDLIGCTTTAETIAIDYKNDWWKDEWKADYEDEKGLTEKFYEDFHMYCPEYLHCDSCDKYGMSGNMIFDGDFYCDLCHLKDHLEDLEKLVKDLDNQFLDDLRRMVYG